MKLYYYKFDKHANFGDELNPWIWKQLIPHILDEDKRTLFVGIGTLLNRKLPKAEKTVVFGTGVGYGYGTVPKINDSWTIYCVRGPLSAQALGVPEDLAVTDAGLLVRRLFPANYSKTQQFAFMPHFKHAISASSAWASICEQLGFAYIDPCWSIEKVLSAISETEILIAEAMHGAIIADALRVPWIPIKTSANINSFKWQDWCLSLGIEYQPRYVMPLWDFYPVFPEAPSTRLRIRPEINYWIDWLKQEQLNVFNKIGGDPNQRVARQLMDIAKTAQPFLSDELIVERLTHELEARLEQFKNDVRIGCFF
ncbi:MULTISPECIES: polysaccharide pyruvyl transferase family protein [unclassified Coleofasciculus]|uniref:polysaccharide pyruvyl transferase family protein n=1 Tax=unclassified Coleofasciculus TaxID=2692782 RepID=UPI001880041C|nr:MULTISPECIES: polysaccharide pyruvyl transferase family protein [unclassified Coleofasciculus]MBE9124677.1 polysaccharide pyruvyl transferase family protein [Coleofasciculus sp. LEGE 07081]MBE9147004.1 polysaccharide pyruvyl transferase family protein [Coleofasciculus sp. LEGE 07092]